MKRRYTLNIFISMVIGVIFFGTVLSPAIRNAYLGLILGTAGCMFISWIITAVVRENESMDHTDVIPDKSQKGSLPHPDSYQPACGIGKPLGIHNQGV